MKKITLLIQVVLCCFAMCLEGQGLPEHYVPLPPKYLANIDLSVYRQQAATIAASAYDITKTLPRGYVKDGSVDYTTFIQSALDSHKDVIMPNFTVLVNDVGLVMRDGNRVVFAPQSKIILKPSTLSHYSIIKIVNVKNVSIYFPVVFGDRNQHLATDGQWGMGINIQSSENVNLYNPKISLCWGDGIYVGQKNHVTSKNIAVYNAELDFNRRNGMSVTCVDGLKLIRPVISNTTGQAPMAGIDVEPNSNQDVIDNIDMENPITFFNTRYGIVLSLGKLIGPDPKSVNITVNNHINEGSFFGFTIFSYKKPITVLPFTGKIEINNPIWMYSSKDAFKPYTIHNYGFKLIVKNPQIIKRYKDKTLHSDTARLNEMRMNMRSLKNVQLQ